MPKSEQYLNTLLRSLPHTVYALDLQTGEVLFSNRDEFLGYDCAALTAPGSILHAVFYEDRAAVEAFWRELTTLKEERVCEIECRIQHKDGGWEWVRIRGTVGARDADGTPREVTQVLSIITMYKEVELTLQQYGNSLEEVVAERTAELRILIETSPDAIMRVNVSGRLLMANAQAAQLFGYEDAETMRAEISDVKVLMVPEERERFERIQWKSKTARTSEFMLLRHDGAAFPAEVRASFLWDKAGDVEEVIVVVRDITARQEAERENARLFEQVNRHREQLRALAARLAEAEESERQRLSRDLHDLVGQNLTTLNINLNIIQAQQPGLADNAYMQESIALVQHTTKQIRQIMADLRPPVLDDWGLLAALKWYGERVASRGNFRFALHGEVPDPPLSMPVSTVLFRVAQEALTNVLKHAQASEVTVWLHANDQRIHVVIEDDGVGFEAGEPAMWDTDRGWGLIFMAERVAAMGGEYRIESQPGEGTCVIMEMPR